MENGATALVKASPLIHMAERFHIEPAKLLEVLKATVIRPTDKHTPTNEEIAAFVMVANEYHLNPLTREIHAFVGQGGNVVPIVGVDGWVHLVNREKDFDGVTFEEQQDKDGRPLATTCTMYMKDRSHPVQVTEWFAECKRNTIPWNTMPRRMLRHKAYIQAARIAFGLSGIYDEDEARDIMRAPKIVENEAKTKAQAVKDRLAGVGQADEKDKEPPCIDEAPAAPAPEPPADSDDADALALTDALDDIRDRIGQADSIADLNICGQLMRRHEKWMGPDNYALVLKVWQAKYKELKARA